MSDADDLPAWAPKGEQPGATRVQERPAEQRNWRSGLLEGVLILVVLICLGVGGYVLYLQWSAEPPAIGTTTGDETGDEAAAADDGAATGDQTGDGDTVGGAAAESTTSTIGVATPAVNGDCEVRCSRIKAGVLYLEGRLPDQEAYDSQQELAVATMGGDESRVVNNVEVSSDAPVSVDSYRVYIDDVVLFETGSAELDPVQAEVLGLGVAYLAVSEEATITVVGRTDATGDAVQNYELSLERARAVKEYYVSAGAPADRIFVVPKGEADASGADTPEDRRVEFQLGRADQPPPEGAVDTD